MDPTPTAEELENISLCAQKLWDLDSNKLEPEVDYGINVQGGKTVSSRGDSANERLFRGVSSSVWERTTYRTFNNLLNNYVKETGVRETMTDHELQESRAFVDAVMNTAPMEYVHRYLVAKDLASRHRMEFKRMLFDLWFAFYRRDGEDDSSGFEHVFVGEIDDGQTKGFHNWIQFFNEETRGRVDYRGYILPRSSQPVPDGHERVLTLQLAWEGDVKPISTIFIGSSPEFELALYTLYFIAGGQRNYVDFLNYRLSIRCYKIHGDKIATTYVAVEDEH